MRFGRRWRSILICSCVCLTAWRGSESPARAAEPQALTNISEIQALKPEEAAKGRPVRLEAVVTCSDPEYMYFCVQDATGGIFVVPQPNQVSRAVGQRVVVRGETGLGLQMPLVKDAVWESLGAGEMPTPTPLSANRLATGLDVGRWLEVTGRVESVETERGRLLLNLNCDGVRLQALLRRAPALDHQPGRWAGASVRVWGVGAHEMSNGQVGVPRLLVNSRDDVWRNQQETRPSFSLPLVSLGTLTNLDASEEPRVKVLGQVAGINSNNGTWRIRDATGLATVRGLTNDVRMNDYFEVVGIARRERRTTLLSDAAARWMARPQATKSNLALGLTNWVPGLTTVGEVHALTPEEARRGWPARLKGVVTYSDLKNPARVCLQDDSGGIWVRMPRMTNVLTAPLYVEVEGYTTAGPYRPELQSARLLVQRPSQFPSAQNVSMQEALAGEWDGQWIKLQGSVRDGRLERDSLVLQIMNAGGRARVEIPGFTNETPLGELIDAEVRVRGVCNSTFNPRGQITGVRLYTPTLAQVLIDKPAPDDPFAGPRRDIATLLDYNPPGALPHRVLVRGVVTISRSARRLCLRDDKSAAYVQLARPEPVQEGDLVEVVGYPTTTPGQRAPLLQDALLRRLGRGEVQRPVQAALNQLRNGVLDAELVRLSATLLDATTSSNQAILRLRWDQFLFDAVVERNPTDPPLRLEHGSELEITGVCLTMLDAQRRPGTFQVLLRSRDDLRVVKTPPWWSLERTVATLAFAALLIGGALGWVWLLRRRVQNQTGVIQQRTAREQTLETRYRDLFENATDIVCTLDLAGNITSINPAGERILGCLLPNGQMAQLADLVVPEDRSRLTELLADRPDTPVSASCELSLRTPTGRLVRLEINSRPLLQDGQVKGLQAIARDTTERHALEEKLRQAAKMESVGRLAGGIAHDFNNILTAIGGNAALILEEPGLEGSLRTAVTEVSKASERAAKLTSQLLTFSRRQPMRLLPVELNGVVADISRLLRRLLGEHIQLQVNYGPNPITIAADQGMIEQVIMNLAVNARDAIEARAGSAPPGRLVVSTAVVRFGPEDARHHPQRRSGEFACLRVQDNGCGIDPAVLGNLFEPFYTTKDVGKGTGLGLATVYGIVEEHDGWIEVDSTVGQGAEFCIFLPLDTKAHPAVVEETLPPARGGKETILLVEDEASVRDMAERALSRLGYRVLTAESGAHALRIWALHSKKVDLLLTDVVMPEGISGFDLAERLHRENPGLPIIYTSGYGMEAAEKRLRKGITLLPKPFSVRALSQTVRECLDAR